MYRRRTYSFRGTSRFQKRPGRFMYGGNGRQTSFDPSLLINKAIDYEEEVYTPSHNFSDFSLHERLKKTIEKRGYAKPTPIQDQAIPPVLEGRDVVGIANTGTGKTAAFLIPLINKLIENPKEKILIVTPTRELAAQIRDECIAFAEGMNVSGVLCIGGVGINPQKERLRRNPQIVVGTPGRLRDLEEQRALNLSMITTIVLDEVDRMLDMGFIHDVKYLISRLPEKRHSLFFSATMTPTVQSVMREFLYNPVTISVKSRETAAGVHQDIVKVAGRNKVDVLHELLMTKGFNRVLVFGRTKMGTERVTKELYKRRISVASIHGNKSQFQRQRAIEDFKSNKIQVLMATDVAARGLDIKDVTHVINFDLPQTYEDYIHRIGRTGRADQKGIALTFVE